MATKVKPGEVLAIKIGAEMDEAGLPSAFVINAVKAAMKYKGILNLMLMWQEESSSDERNEIVADIQEGLDDLGQTQKVVGTYVRFDDLDSIAENIMAFKNSLRLTVEDKGGIQHLADLTGIPQPSLSRFFNSASMPRRATLLKIANALQLSQVEIATEWVQL